jgi:hypothetical protein
MCVMNEYITYSLDNQNIYTRRINENQILLPNNLKLTNQELKRIYKKLII